MACSGDILMVSVRGDLDVTTTRSLRNYLRHHTGTSCRRIILDLADTARIDSMGMSLIFAAARRMHEEGGLLSLVNVNDAVYRSLVICRLVDFVPVSPLAAKPPIPALDPAVRPLWHSTMRVGPAQLSEARRRMERLLSATKLSPDEVFDLTLAGGEALGNAVDHACAEGVLLTLAAYPDRVVVEVTDCGEGFDPEAGAAGASGGDGLERGRGIRLMRLLADSVEIRRKESGEGTLVRLVKLFTPSAPAARPA